MKVLLSIKPQYVESILSGKKSYEFRRMIFAAQIDTVVIYATKPIGRVVGEFGIELHHVDHALGVLALPDRQVQCDTGRPTTGTVAPVVVLNRFGKHRGALIRQIDARRPVEPHLHTVTQQVGK